MTILRVAYQTDVYVEPSEEDGILEFSGRIREYDDRDRETEIGRVEFVILRSYRSEEHGYSIGDVADGHDADWGDIALKLYNSDGEIGIDVVDPSGGRILYLHTMHIAPAFRGRNIGLHVIENVIRTFGDGIGLAALHPSPLEKRTGGKTEGKLRLANYWARAGFQPFGDTGIYWRDLAMKEPRLPKLRARARTVKR